MTSIRDIGLVVPARGYSQRPDPGAASHHRRRRRRRGRGRGTPIGLGRLLGVGRPVRQAHYELGELGHPDLT
jgi:hypothetical protein